MTETKMALMTRLRAEGRWEEADKFREETRARLRAEEMCRNEAREEAWRLTAETYPPRRVERQSPRVNAPRIEEVNAGVILEPSEDERRELVELAQTPGAWKGNLTEALRWAKTNWELDVTPSQARSVLEWLLWKLCSEDSDRFIVLHFVDYCLRRGLTFQSFICQNATELQRRLRQQFVDDHAREKDAARCDAQKQMLGESEDSPSHQDSGAIPQDAKA